MRFTFQSPHFLRKSTFLFGSNRFYVQIYAKLVGSQNYFKDCMLCFSAVQHLYLLSSSG